MMFERFTDEARRVVVASKEEAKRLGHGRIGAGHILLALISHDRGAAEAIRSMGVPPEAFCAKVGEAIGEAGEAGDPQFTPEAKELVRAAVDEADRWGQHLVLPEHLLLTLLAKEDEVPARMLAESGVDLEKLRNGILDRIAGESPAVGPKCAKCGAPTEEFGKVRELSLPIENGRRVNIYAYFCGRCGATYGLVKGPHGQ